MIIQLQKDVQLQNQLSDHFNKYIFFYAHLQKKKKLSTSVWYISELTKKIILTPGNGGIKDMFWRGNMNQI